MNDYDEAMSSEAFATAMRRAGNELDRQLLKPPVTFIDGKPLTIIDVDSADAILRAEVERERRSNALDVKRMALASLGPDDNRDGMVIKFRKRFAEDGPEYLYAAIKVGGMWYTTGPTGQRFTWDELRLWLVSGDVPTSEVLYLYEPAG